LSGRLKEQTSQIQKVSAQLEVSKPAVQTVLNNQIKPPVGMKYWEIIADDLSKAGSSWGSVAAVGSTGRTI